MAQCGTGSYICSGMEIEGFLIDGDGARSQAVHKTEHFSAVFGSITPVTPSSR
jgi:hypothetical protein